ncbi:MAG: putative sulfate exporter family transporter [Betaproteobacteria bacterium]|nr:putative sulfate exporter family transporter [Betaproteobacteria bacterium]
MNRHFPGLAVAAVIAIAAMFLSEHYGGPVMLFALLLGMALNFLSHEGKCVSGIQFAASTVLRVGVALLGVRITLTQVTGLGWGTVALVIAAVIATIVAGIVAARLLSQSRIFGVLTGGAVAICGASAALAIGSVLPRHAHTDRDVSFAVIGTATLSTIAMIAYPILAGALGLDHRAAGIFLGGTIHDVAQVVGAGYSISKEAGDTATIVKLLRVAMLLPVVFVISLITHLNSPDNVKKAPLLPWFAVAFAVLVAVNSMGWIPAPLQTGASEVSRWCLVAAIAAIGMKTSLKDMAVMGWKPVALIVVETVFIAAMVLVALRFL